MKEIHIFTDGATPNNQNKSGNRRGGVGVFFGDDDQRNISFGMIENEKQKIKKNIGYLFSNLNGIFFRHLRNIFHYNELNMKILFIEENISAKLRISTKGRLSCL